MTNREQSLFRRNPPATTVDRDDSANLRRFNKRRINRAERHYVSARLRRIG